MSFDVEGIEHATRLVGERTAVVQRVATESRSYYTGEISPEQVAHWVMQFRDPFSIHVALTLLRRLHFVDEAKLSFLLKTAFEQIPADHRSHARIATAGAAGESGSVLAYSFGKALGWSDNELRERWTVFGSDTFSNESLRGAPIVLIDDNIASGIQLEPYLREIFPTYAGTRSVLAKPISPEGVNDIRASAMYLIVAVELGPARQRLHEVAQELGIKLQICSGLQDFAKCLEYGTPLWNSQDEASRARSAIAKISRQLYADKEWNEATVEDRLFGYGNLQKLVVFPYNVPKSLLPIFWKFGEVDGADWMPLFPERGEWQKYSTRIVKAAPELRYLARQVILGTVGRSAPSLEAVISARGVSSRKATITIANQKAINSAFQYYQDGFVPPKPLLMPEAQSQPNTIQSFTLYGVLPHTSPGEISQYNTALSTYVTTSLPRHFADFRRRLVKRTHDVTFRLRVYNHGSQKATGTTVLLELPKGLTCYLSRSRLPRCPLPPNPPGPIAIAFGGEPQGLADRRQLLEKYLGTDEDFPQYMSLAREEERLVLQVQFGTILQGLFQDRIIPNLSVSGPGDYVVAYKVIAEETRTAIGGTFHFQTSEAAESEGSDWELDGLQSRIGLL